MNHLKHLLLLVCALCSTSVFAGPVTKSEAKSAAAAFLQQRNKNVTLVDEPKRAAKTSNGTTSTTEAYYYVFNTTGGNGYVIVSGDNRTTQILGYVDSGTFDENNLPTNMKAWLDGYAQQIKALDQMDDATAAARLAAPKREKKATRDAISPLITTKWDQATPYWNHCPQFMNVEDNDTTSERAYTGCVATAMCQVMNYHKHPAQSSKEIPSYSVSYYLGNYEYGTFETDALPVRSFDWEHMRDTYTGAESEEYTEAVSWLMLYAGCAAEMQYGKTASGTSDPKIPIALNNYFDYDAKLVYRSDYDQDAWEELIYQELAAGRPMIYNGRAGSGGGHSFVCDGFEYGDYFHINWGWGGMGDGFFQLSILNPRESGIGGSSSSEGYNIDQTAIIGITPGFTGSSSSGDTEEVDHRLTVYNMYPWSNSSYFSRDSESEGFKLTKRKYIKVVAEDHIDDGTKYYRGIALYDMEGNFVELIMSTSYASSSLSTTDSWPSSTDTQSYTFAKGLTGTYKIVPVCKLSDGTEWLPMLESDRYYLEITMTATTATFVQHPLNDLTASNFRFTGGEKVGVQEQCTVTVTNNSEDRFNGKLYFYLTNEQIDEYGEYFTVVEAEVAGGASKDVTFNFTPQNAGEKTAQLSLYDSSYGGEKINGTGMVTIDEASTSKMNLSVEISAVGADEENKIIYDSHAKFKVDITNNGDGEYAKYVLAPFFIVTDDGGEMITYKNQSLTIQAGETKTLYFEFDNLAYESRYSLNIYGKNENDSLKNLIKKGESKIYTIKHGLVKWTSDGTRTGIKPEASMTIPDDAAAVSFEGITSIVNSVTPNANPNTLYFFADNETAVNGLDGKNVVIGKNAETINLQDGYDFYTPQGFTAAEISYTRQFDKGHNGTSKDGWSTITLPFAAQTIKQDAKTIDWFHTKSDTGKNLWIYDFGAEDGETIYFRHINELKANHPYIIAVPDDYWGSAWDLRNKDITFSATNANVVTEGISMTSRDNYVFVGNEVEQSFTDIYVMNDAGNNFELTSSANVNPFRSYFKAINESAATAKQLAIAFEDQTTTAIGNIDAAKPANNKVYDLQGRLIPNANQQRLDKGIYIINGKKVVVK